MSLSAAAELQPWPLWQRMLFRFLFIFFLLIIGPWTWIEFIPSLGKLVTPWYKLMDYVVNATNSMLFHVRPVLVPMNGSGDTSFGWAELWTCLCLAGAGCVIWSAVDYRRQSYRGLRYLLRLMVRYDVILVAMAYGFQKVFLLQMPFPNISEMATPLGDFLPMRLSWMFIGYSGPYQFFSGCMELLVGVLLLYRRTATLGAAMAVAVFTNVLMLNLSYDIPVKIFSIELVVLSLYLLAQDWRRFVSFFILNRPAEVCEVYHHPLERRWVRIGRVLIKAAFIVVAIVMPLNGIFGYRKRIEASMRPGPLKEGLYDVVAYAVIGDTLNHTSADTLRWENVVLDAGGIGSIRTRDSRLRQRYGRGYCYYLLDTPKHRVSFVDIANSDSTLMSFRYTVSDNGNIGLLGSRDQDSLYVLLKPNGHHYQLAERQFHWLSEANR